MRIPVVQELARSGIDHLPKRFTRVPPTDRTCYTLNFPPVISVARLKEGSEADGRAAELARLASGVKEWGLVLVTEHGIGSSVLHGVRDAVEGFFGLSFEEKKRCVGSYASVDNLGYGRNFVRSDDQPFDWIDRLAMKAAPPGADGGLDVWPRKPPNFRELMQNYVSEARIVLDELLKALAEGPDRALGLTPHSDASSLTLLMEFGVTAGLQVLKSQEWVTIPWPKDSLIVVVGDLLEIMSNGRVKSPWHRAVAQSDGDRFSVALFYNPSPQTQIKPIENAPNKSDGYRKMIVGEYLQHYYRNAPQNEKRAILYAKD
ncbi:hypothetical protein SLE2022_209720 [Rubroshorea leprosula]